MVRTVVRMQMDMLCCAQSMADLESVCMITCPFLRDMWSGAPMIATVFAQSKASSVTLMDVGFPLLLGLMIMEVGEMPHALFGQSVSKPIPLDAYVAWDPVYDYSSTLIQDSLGYGEYRGQKVVVLGVLMFLDRLALMVVDRLASMFLDRLTPM